MSIIKNRTPYLGKIKLKFEKFPHYTGGSAGVLNHVHLDLGFTKLVSRMLPHRSKDLGYSIDPYKVALIKHYTGGKIAKHEWWVVKGVDDSFTSRQAPSNPDDILFHGVLENSFTSQNGEYIGDIQRGWWYYENSLKVCEAYPHGVAEKVDRKTDETIGYYGYTHRGGNLFKIGDRLFDESYTPVKKDYDEAEWKKWEADFMKSWNREDDFGKKCMTADRIAYVMPFNKRGKKVIETLDEAKQAAINMSKYLS